MTIRDYIGALAYLAYAITVIAGALYLAPHCTRHIRDWGDLSLRGPDACVDQRRVAFQLSPKELTR